MFIFKNNRVNPIGTMTTMHNKKLLVLFTLMVNLVTAQTEFQISFNKIDRPSKENLRISFEDSSGNKGLLPISIIKGKEKGPVFTVIAGIHGYEYPPIMATMELLQEIDIEKLKGTLIVVPIANTASFYTRTPYINPQDQLNLNRIFPGNAEGSITEQIAHFMTTQIIPVTDVFLDIHGGDACEDLIPFICYYNNPKKKEQTELARQLSENSGFELVVSYGYTLKDDEAAKYAFKQAVQDGKTALSIECGKLGNVQKEEVTLVKKGIYNIMDDLDMYANGAGPHPNIKYGTSQSYIRATATGIFYSDFKAGDAVTKDTTVGYTTDEFGTILETFKAPNDGIVLYKLGTPPVNSSDTVMCITTID